MIDITTVTWAQLKNPLALAALLVAFLAVLKRGKLLSGSRRIHIVGFVAAQAFAQVAFWRCGSRWSAYAIADAALVGGIAVILALGGHTIIQKRLAARSPPEPEA